MSSSNSKFTRPLRDRRRQSREVSSKKSTITTTDTEEEKNDEDILQAALAESQLVLRAEQQAKEFQADTQQLPVDSKSAVREVLYKDGATPLFNAIEESRWTEALGLMESKPEEVSTWVSSTGTENTTFGWSLWRRLPIHEACRRQPPAWFLAALLKAAPWSIEATTQFGELPLHLAVEMGAAPEVINLLIVHWYPSIRVLNNSCRTALQIVMEADAYHQEDRIYVQESLRHAHTNLIAMESEWRKEMDSMNKAHQDYVRELESKHEREIQSEKDQQMNLQKQLARVEGHLQQYQEERRSLERTLSSHHVEKGTWKEILETKEETVEELIRKIEGREKELNLSQEQLHEKVNLIAQLQTRIHDLENDLRNVVLFQHTTVYSSLQQSQLQIQSLQTAHDKLAGVLQGQAQGLDLLLQKRQIRPPTPPAQPPTPSEKELKKSNIPIQEIISQESMVAASAAAAEAAAAAIHYAEYEQYEKRVYQEMEEEIQKREKISLVEDEVESP